jgi:hypothetical protein
MDDAYHYLHEHGMHGNHRTSCFPHDPAKILIPSPNGLHGEPASRVSLPEVNIENVQGDDGVVIKQSIVSVEGSLHHGAKKSKNGCSNPASNGEPSGAAKPVVLVWSAPDSDSLQRVLQGYGPFYKSNVAGSVDQINSLAHTLATRRDSFLWRTFSIVKVTTEDFITVEPVRSSMGGGVTFVFSGQGAQYVGMGRELIRYPVFRETLCCADSCFQQLGCDWSILGMFILAFHSICVHLNFNR